MIVTIELWDTPIPHLMAANIVTTVFSVTNSTGDNR